MDTLRSEIDDLTAFFAEKQAIDALPTKGSEVDWYWYLQYGWRLGAARMLLTLVSSCIGWLLAFTFFPQGEFEGFLLGFMVGIVLVALVPMIASWCHYKPKKKLETVIWNGGLVNRLIFMIKPEEIPLELLRKNWHVIENVMTQPVYEGSDVEQVYFRLQNMILPNMR